MTSAMFKDLLVQTFRDPQSVARRLIDARFPPQTVWMAFGLVVVVAVLMAAGLAMILPRPEPSPEAGSTLALTPFHYAGLMAGLLIMVVISFFVSGRMLGGQGRFMDVLVCLTWLQAVMLALQCAQAVITVIVPEATVAVMMVLIFVYFWLLASFTQAFHQFDSKLRTVFALVVGFLVLGVLGNIVLAAVGFNPMGEL